MDKSSSLWIWHVPNCFGSIMGMGGVLSVWLPQVSHQKRDFKAEPWGGANGQTELWLVPATERPSLRTELTLRVTMCVYAF